MNQQTCPNCNHHLEIEFCNQKQFQAEIWSCHNCYWSGVKKILKDSYEDISEEEFAKERKFANQVAKKLLPKQKIKIRFVEELEDSRKFSNTRLWIPTDEVIDILFTRQVLQKSAVFKIALPHELAHASDNVRFHPDYDLNSTLFSRRCSRCGIPHPGKGHDEIWHDKYDEFRNKLLKI